jgi:type I restriction enzyme S subunit
MWKAVALGEILRQVSRPVAVDPDKTYRLLGAHWYAKGLYVKEEKPGTEIRASNLFEVRAGDFVYNRLFAWKGAFALANPEHEGCFVSNEFPCFEADRERLDPRFLWLYFSRETAWSEALGLSSGSTPTSRNRLKEDQFLAMTIPLPSLPEQRRIVARIEELAAKIEQARALHMDALEQGDALLGAASRSFFEQHSFVARRARLESVTTRITKGESPNWQGFTYQETGPVFIRSENVLWGALDLSNRSCIPREFHDKLSRSQLRPGDVLINLVGASIGRCCVTPPHIGEANVNQAVAVITPDPTVLDSRYLMHFLLSPPAQEVVHGGKVDTARANISLGDLADLSLPVLPLPEQHRIVNHLDDLRAKVNEVKRLQTESAVELDALLPSILDKAFKGEL